jgi:hypothetical protein
VATAEDDHASPLRDLMAEATGGSYRAFGSLQEAQSDPDGAVILEGDDGGQLYLAFPARAVNCTEESLSLLLLDLDEICWPGNDADMARVIYERRPVGQGVAGGMGGGVVSPGGWIHPAITALGIEAEIRSVLDGTSPRVSEEARRLRRP